LAAPTIWGAREIAPDALRKGLARLWPSLRVEIMNDVTAAGYRYLRSPEDEFCIVTVSSGIGNKMFINGRPLVGRSGRGGELGHLEVDSSEDAPLCECGGRGHLGAVSSGRAALEYARKRARVGWEGDGVKNPAMGATGFKVDRLTSSDLAVAFKRAEPWAIEVIEHVAAPLGWALAAMHMAIGVARFVLIGGFALALGESYRQLVARAAGARCWECSGDWSTMVELGVDDDWSGLLGAGRVGSLEDRRP
jgi:glucokinase